MANDLGKLKVPFYEHMRTLVDMKDQLYSYFRYSSKAWRAIQDYIYKHQKTNALVDHPEDHRIPCHRGTGPAISFVQASLYAKNYDDPHNPKEADVYRLEFTVGYVHKDEWDDDYPRERSKKFEIQVPMELELNFSQDRFRQWIARLAEEKNGKDREKTLKHLRKLKAENPELWGEV